MLAVRVLPGACWGGRAHAYRPQQTLLAPACAAEFADFVGTGWYKLLLESCS